MLDGPLEFLSQRPLPDAGGERNYRCPLTLADSVVLGSYSSSSVKWVF